MTRKERMERFDEIKGAIRDLKDMNGDSLYSWTIDELIKAKAVPEALIRGEDKAVDERDALEEAEKGMADRLMRIRNRPGVAARGEALAQEYVAWAAKAIEDSADYDVTHDCG